MYVWRHRIDRQSALLNATVATKLHGSVYPIDVFLTNERDRKFGGKFADDRLR